MDEKMQLEAEMVDIKAMFEHPGWTALKRHTQVRMDAFREGFPFNVSTVEQLYFVRGVMATLNELLVMDAPPAEPEAAEDEA